MITACINERKLFNRHSLPRAHYKGKDNSISDATPSKLSMFKGQGRINKPRLL